ncbi:hypothetical protein F7725_007645 [Dissostichus mawsoni]|uniref:Uncharacterized protein n=1 Tax=Dissostichus mawsoni TaxID=36200 RepID=A0A7J5Y4Z6_DISMA|nr:hypothetical protein F7725_007645 [Dissostichus mawsoni]
MVEDLHFISSSASVAAVRNLANTVINYGTRYTVGMILCFGSTGGLPDFAEIIQMAILDNCVHFIVKTSKIFPTGGHWEKGTLEQQTLGDVIPLVAYTGRKTLGYSQTLAEMEAKLRVLIDDRIEKLVLPAGIPPTVEELTNVVKETYAVIDEFSLQYLDSDFEDYFTLNQTDQIKHKDTVKVVYAEQKTLNLLPIDGSSFLQSSTEYDSASNAESSAGTSSSHDTIILSNQSTAECREPWPKQFPVPRFAFETGMYLERANEDYKKDGKLLTTSKIQDEFHRITMVHLESKFMSKLDEYTPGLLKLFHSKGGTMGLKLKALLLQTPSNPNINITRDVVIRCLMVYLGERTDQLLKNEDSASQDLAVQGMAIYSIKTNASEGSHDIGIVVEGIRVLTSQGTIPRACCMLIGIAYAVNLAYPKQLKYTFEAFQKLFLELDCSKLSPKLNSLKNKLLA